MAGNECSLGSDQVAENERIDGELARGTRTPGSTTGQQSSRRNVLSLRCFFYAHIAMKVKFIALEQSSGTGVGHELARVRHALR